MVHVRSGVIRNYAQMIVVAPIDSIGRSWAAPNRCNAMDWSRSRLG